MSTYMYVGKEDDNVEGTLRGRVLYKLASTISRKDIVSCFDRFFIFVYCIDNIDYIVVATCNKNRQNLSKVLGES